MAVSVLFVEAKSVYKTMDGLDAWDVERDALRWPGGNPVVAHPPCRLWCQLRRFSTAPQSEKFLALWAVDQVRRWGGVLEHPAYSTLWEAAQLPLPGKGLDAYGGWTLAVPQFWWGHLARKNTWLYIVGCAPQNTPAIPLRLGTPEYIVGGRRNRHSTPAMPISQRSSTPPSLCPVADCSGQPVRSALRNSLENPHKSLSNTSSLA